MGLMSLFGKGPLGEKKIAKIAKLASNPFAQSEVRMRELQRLLADGSSAAMRGALKRFAANASGSIADEEEKRWLEDALVERGELALEPLRDYIRTEKQLTYALRAYRRLSPPEETVRFFLEVMHLYGPDDHRSADAKLQLVCQLLDFMADARVVPGLVDFLLDHSDDVRWAVMDMLERAADAGSLPAEVRARAEELFTELVTEPSVGPRIQTRATEILAAREWPLREGVEALAPFVSDSYFVDKKRFVRRRIKR